MSRNFKWGTYKLSHLTREARWIRRYKEDEFGFALVSSKYSNIKLSRVNHGEEMGCEICFPHGMETINNRYTSFQRSWKKRRRFQYKN
ncbi:MAG: phosphate ABC transporter substrate-binding protein [Gammaproteobacteria bacterium]|nr:phosphate ABC transporter substrate-binding protein [Gammaproteobacteria bacterium]